jgi:uncharacterized protein
MRDQFKAAMKAALKAGDKVRLDTVRSVLAAIQYEEMERKVDNLTDEQITAIVQRESKKRREELEFAEQAKRPELKDKFLAEIKILEEFLPKQLSAPELETIITGLKTNTPGLNVGAAMKLLKETYAGQYDGKLASEVVKRVLG